MDGLTVPNHTKTRPAMRSMGFSTRNVALWTCPRPDLRHSSAGLLHEVLHGRTPESIVPRVTPRYLDRFVRRRSCLVRGQLNVIWGGCGQRRTDRRPKRRTMASSARSEAVGSESLRLTTA